MGILLSEKKRNVSFLFLTNVYENGFKLGRGSEGAIPVVRAELRVNLLEEEDFCIGLSCSASS